MVSFKIYLEEKEEAERVVEEAKQRLVKYSLLSIADVKGLVDMLTTHVDHRRGWTSLEGVSIDQKFGKFLITFPPSEVI